MYNFPLEFIPVLYFHLIHEYFCYPFIEFLWQNSSLEMIIFHTTNLRIFDRISATTSKRHYMVNCCILI